MIELLLVLLFLFSLWVFGRGFLLACCAGECSWLAMPIGLCLVGLVGNVLYFTFGFTASMIHLLFLGALVPTAVVVVRRGIPFGEWGKLLAALGVFLYLSLPAFIGGEQYYAFRGNHWDHFNYINQALTLWANPYPVYHHAAVSKFLEKDILAHGMPFIRARPAVGLVLALLLPAGWGNLHLFSFFYVTALWAVVFAASCLAWTRILEAYQWTNRDFLFRLAPPFAYTIGFWGQYIFDIDAWSEMSTLSLLLAMVFQYIRLLQRLLDPSMQQGKSIFSGYVTTGILAAGSFLFYPENTLIHAGLLLSATIVWCVATRQVPRFSTVLSLAVFSVAVLLMAAAPFWDGTVRFLFSQLKLTAVQAQVYWRYFDRYWLGIHGNVLFAQLRPAVVHGLGLRGAFEHYWHTVGIPSLLGCLSAFANFILALMGMFFITPDYSTVIVIKYGWILITVLLAAAAIYSLAVVLFVRFKDNQTALFLRAFFLSGVLFLVYLLKKKSLWSFGKGLSFFSPYLFLVICLGLVDTGNALAGRVIRAFVIIFLVAQLGFGVYRLWSARDPNGIGYDNLTYPSIEDTSMKTAYRWDVDARHFVPCRDVDLNGIADPFYLEYIKEKFTYRQILYFSSLPVMSYFNIGDQIGFQQPAVTDCKIR